MGILNEQQIKELSGLYRRRSDLRSAIDCARHTDAFRDAVEKSFNGTGSNSSIREALGGVNDMSSMLKAAAIDRLATYLKQAEADILAAGGEP